MARKTKSVSKPLVSSKLASTVSLPARPVKPAVPSLGAQAVRRPAKPESLSKRQMTAKDAGDASPLFGRVSARGDRGGEAFERWCAAQGIDSREKRTAEQWEELNAQFASRPIHGHRRKARGGGHNLNRDDAR